MRYIQHRTLGSGFQVSMSTEDALPILEAGEIWAPQEWSIGNHANLGWEIYLQVKGRSLWEFDGNRVEIGSNGAYLVQAGLQHKLVRFLDAQTHFFFVVFSPESLPSSIRQAPCWHQPFSLFGAAQSLLLPFEGIIQELSVRQAWQTESCSGYLAAICAALARLSIQERPHRPLTRHPAAEQALRLLRDRPEHPWRLEELARLSGVSAPHLIEVFKDNYGQPPMRTLKRLRLETACRKLEQTENRVTEIALDLGFASSQHFARAFKAEFGLSPTQMRNVWNEKQKA